MRLFLSTGASTLLKFLFLENSEKDVSPRRRSAMKQLTQAVIHKLKEVRLKWVKISLVPQFFKKYRKEKNILILITLSSNHTG